MVNVAAEAKAVEQVNGSIPEDLEGDVSITHSGVSGFDSLHCR
jgi:hypothetical protein